MSKFKSYEDLEREITALKSRLVHQTGVIDAMQKLADRDGDTRIKYAALPGPELAARMAGVNEGNSLWQAVQAVLGEITENEIRAAALPNLSSETAHYNRGRLAAMLDAQAILEDVRRRAQEREKED